MKRLRELAAQLRELARRRPFEVGLLLALALLLVPYRTLLGPGVPSGRDLVPYFYPLKTHLVEALLRRRDALDRPVPMGRPAAPVVAGRGGVRPGKPPLPPPPDGGRREGVDAPARPLRRRRLRRLPARHGPSAPLLGSRGARVGRERDHGLFGELPRALSSAHAVLPWFAAALLHVRSRRDPRSVALLAVATALLIVASVPEPLLAAALLALVLLAGRGEEGGVRERLGAAALWGAAGLLGALLAAPALAAYVVTGLDSIRGVPGALLPGFAAQGALPLARLPDLLADGVVADWTRVIRADGIPGYPYFPSLTPGRVAWILALLALVAGRGARLRALATAVFGVLLALGPATPVFGVLLGVVPYASSIRYPEKYAVLFGFGVVWLAALGAAVLERALGGETGRSRLRRPRAPPRSRPGVDHLAPPSPLSGLPPRGASRRSSRRCRSLAATEASPAALPLRDVRGRRARAGRTTRERRARG